MSEDQKGLENGYATPDEDLEELLESALEDFDTLSGSSISKDQLKPLKKEEETSGKSTSEETWTDEYLVEAQKQFEENLQKLLNPEGSDLLSPEEFGDKIRKMAVEGSKLLSEVTSNSDSPDVSSTIAETLRNLTENMESSQEELDENEMANLMAGLCFGGGSDDMAGVLPFMQSMMQSFLSKEMLHSSIKDLTQKYPTWLEENRAALSEADIEKYNKQLQLMEKICSEYESELPSDSEEIKKGRFSRILNLLEEMQKLGPPPKELVGEDHPLSAENEAIVNQCPVM